MIEINLQISKYPTPEGQNFNVISTATLPRLLKKYKYFSLGNTQHNNGDVVMLFGAAGKGVDLADDLR